MRLLVDQDVYRVTIEVLEKWGHDVATAKQFGMQRASDEELLKKAQETGRLFITRDKDFGSLVFLREEIATGVIFLRIAPKTITEVHAELQRLFIEHKEEELMRLFCVVEPRRHRIRHLKCRS
ncbi:MAG: DUF5615 family PIN-like protein [Deltaproteobacteria bacterium]|nr:DUF5615 family PIN-like protein [Deltaproteobacteria bacterium]